MRTRAIPSLRTVLGSSLAAALLGGSLLPAAHAVGCAKQCVSVSSVVNAAGVPPSVNKLLMGLQFRGNGLAPESARAVAALAKELGQRTAGRPLVLQVAADTGLDAGAARAQADARAKALSQALKNAGAGSDRIEIQAATGG